MSISGTRVWRTAAWGGAALLLLAPALAMRFTAEVNWTASDFLVFAAMLLAALGGFEWMLRAGPSFAWRAGAALTAAGVFLLVWVNLAVGIIGSEDNDANMMYAGVIAVAIGGAVMARGRAGAMMWALLATAAAQVAVAAIALAGGLGTQGVAWPRDVIGATAILTLLWLGAAGLFALARGVRRGA